MKKNTNKLIAYVFIILVVFIVTLSLRVYAVTEE